MRWLHHYMQKSPLFYTWGRRCLFVFMAWMGLLACVNGPEISSSANVAVAEVSSLQVDKSTKVAPQTSASIRPIRTIKPVKPVATIRSAIASKSIAIGKPMDRKQSFQIVGKVEPLQRNWTAATIEHITNKPTVTKPPRDLVMQVAEQMLKLKPIKHPAVTIRPKAITIITAKPVATPKRTAAIPKGTGGGYTCATTTQGTTCSGAGFTTPLASKTPASIRVTPDPITGKVTVSATPAPTVLSAHLQRLVDVLLE